MLIRPSRNSWKSCNVCGQIRKMLSMYLFQSVGLSGCADRKFSSRLPMYIVARAGASLVPIAMPQV